MSGKNPNIPPREMSVEMLSFDDKHINVERKHNTTREVARAWIRNSILSVTVWNGQYERYYGYEGVVYVKLSENKIRAAFSKEEFDAKILSLLEVLKKYGY